MSKGVPQEPTTLAADPSVPSVLRLPQFERGRALRRLAANDNGADWRSIVVRRIIRPARRILASVAALASRVLALWR